MNALHGPATDLALIDELFRVLKGGGKVIGLFPAKYDAGFWRDWLYPPHHLYRRHHAGPTTAPKTTGRDLRAALAQFIEHRTTKRHLRRSELPHITSDGVPFMKSVTSDSSMTPLIRSV